MDNSLIKGTRDRTISKLKEMISPDETIQQISRRTTVKTNKGEHTVWEVGKKNGDIAVFAHSKKKR